MNHIRSEHHSKIQTNMGGGAPFIMAIQGNKNGPTALQNRFAFLFFCGGGIPQVFTLLYDRVQVVLAFGGELHKYSQSVVVPSMPHLFVERVWPVYLHAISDARYFFSVDELLSLGRCARINVVILRHTCDEYHYVGATFAGGRTPIAFAKLDAHNRGAVRSHFERIIPRLDVDIMYAGLPSDRKHKGGNVGNKTKGRKMKKTMKGKRLRKKEERGKDEVGNDHDEEVKTGMGIEESGSEADVEEDSEERQVEEDVEPKWWELPGGEEPEWVQEAKDRDRRAAEEKEEANRKCKEDEADPELSLIHI